MSFAAGIGAGIACGIGCGIAAGQRQARTRIEEHVSALLDSGEVRLFDAEDRPIAIGTLLDEALTEGPAGRRKILLGVLLLTGLAVLGVTLFLILTR